MNNTCDVCHQTIDHHDNAHSGHADVCPDGRDCTHDVWFHVDCCPVCDGTLTPPPATVTITLPFDVGRALASGNVSHVNRMILIRACDAALGRSTSVNWPEEINRRLNDLCEETGLDLSVGYIGNCDSPRGNGTWINDDRRWSMWINNAAELTSMNRVSIGSYRTENLASLFDRMTVDEIANELDRLDRVAKSSALEHWINGRRAGWRAVSVKDWTGEILVTQQESEQKLVRLLTR
jgi:hypothetical protein